MSDSSKDFPIAENQDHSGNITELLSAWRDGEAHAFEDLAPMVYDQLRAMARSYLHGERKDHTLQPTALLNEAFVRMLEANQISFDNRAMFFGFAGKVMRHVLVDYARAKSAAKRGKDAVIVEFDDGLDQLPIKQLDSAALMDLDRALTQLERIDPVKSKIVELRYFAGFEMSEIAKILSVNRKTVHRKWNAASLWLAKSISEQSTTATS